MMGDKSDSRLIAGAMILGKKNVDKLYEAGKEAERKRIRGMLDNRIQQLERCLKKLHTEKDRVDVLMTRARHCELEAMDKLIKGDGK